MRIVRKRRQILGSKESGQRTKRVVMGRRDSLPQPFVQVLDLARPETGNRHAAPIRPLPLGMGGTTRPFARRALHDQLVMHELPAPVALRAMVRMPHFQQHSAQDGKDSLALVGEADRPKPIRDPPRVSAVFGGFRDQFPHFGLDHGLLLVPNVRHDLLIDQSFRLPQPFKHHVAVAVEDLQYRPA